MLTSRRSPPLGDTLAYRVVGCGERYLHNGENLEEVVFGEVLVRVVFV